MTADAPDPIAQAKASQQSLLAALGDDDPAEAQSQAPAAIQAMIAIEAARRR